MRVKWQQVESVVRDVFLTMRRINLTCESRSHSADTVLKIQGSKWKTNNRDSRLKIIRSDHSPWVKTISFAICHSWVFLYTSAPGESSYVMDFEHLYKEYNKSNWSFMPDLQNHLAESKYGSATILSNFNVNQNRGNVSTTDGSWVFPPLIPVSNLPSREIKYS